MRETRQQVRLRHPVTLLLVRCVGREVSAGGLFAAGRDGARRRVEPIQTRARARQGTRAPRSERVEPACRCRRLRKKYIVASTSSTRVWSFACEGAGETRGTPTRPRSPPRETAPTVSLPGPRSKAFGRPPLRWWPRLRTSSPTPHACPSQTKTRRSVLPSLTDDERVGADRESERARRRRLDRDRSRPPARAEMRRPRAPSCAGRASSGPRTERRSASATKATPRVSKAPRPGGDV